MLRLAIVFAWGACLVGCQALQLGPSNDRDWSPDLAKLSTTEFEGDRATVRNIRNCSYRSTTDYTVNYYDKTYDLTELDEVNFIVVPFSDIPGGAHTFLSFGFKGRDYVAVSIEIRREKGEAYKAFKGIMREFEIIYVVGDERDLIGLRANHRLEDVYVYRARITPEKARVLFTDVMTRANKLAEQPEYYNTLTNNCTTNVRRHINNIAPDRIRYSYEVLLPGFSDRLAYNLGLLDTEDSFEQTKLRARVNAQAFVARDRDDFSVQIRR